jgi:hypothetical protein
MAETTRLEDARVDLTSTLEEVERERAAPDRDERFRILVLGDFSGRDSRGAKDLADLAGARTPVRVDRDNIEELPGDLDTKVRVQLLEHGAPLTFAIRSFEDLHPDRLFTDTAPFDALYRTRQGLSSGDPDEYRQAAGNVSLWGLSSTVIASVGATGKGLPPKPKPIPVYRGGRLVDPDADSGKSEKESFAEDLLAGARKQGRGTTEDVRRLARQVVAGHVAPKPPPDREGLLASTDVAIGSWMRTLLREPAFQQIEAAWRALDLLVRRVDEDAVEIHVLDVSRTELAEDLRRRDLAESGAYRVLVEDAVERDGG